jgi:hypothetical protein
MNIEEEKVFKPNIMFNKSEGFIECFYEDACSYSPVEVEEGHTIYYSTDGEGRVVGYKIELRMNETIEVFFK